MRRALLLLMVGYGVIAGVSNQHDPSWRAAHTRSATSPADYHTPRQPHPIGAAVVERAVRFALAQRGKPYVYGAAGPDAYDCSGLVQAAFRPAGIRLPRTAEEQFHVGERVYGRAKLRRGDLVFFVSPGLSGWHVGLYLGDGQMVEAAGREFGVRIGAIDREGWRGAVRITKQGGGA
jgi:peptidoglycan DL-endopeptidase CwlO